MAKTMRDIALEAAWPAVPPSQSLPNEVLEAIALAVAVAVLNEASDRLSNLTLDCGCSLTVSEWADRYDSEQK
jgi:hypothetical protein